MDKLGEVGIVLDAEEHVTVSTNSVWNAQLLELFILWGGSLEVCSGFLQGHVGEARGDLIHCEPEHHDPVAAGGWYLAGPLIPCLDSGVPHSAQIEGPVPGLDSIQLLGDPLLKEQVGVPRVVEDHDVAAILPVGVAEHEKGRVIQLGGELLPSWSQFPELGHCLGERKVLAVASSVSAALAHDGVVGGRALDRAQVQRAGRILLQRDSSRVFRGLAGLTLVRKTAVGEAHVPLEQLLRELLQELPIVLLVLEADPAVETAAVIGAGVAVLGGLGDRAGVLALLPGVEEDLGVHAALAEPGVSGAGAAFLIGHPSPSWTARGKVAVVFLIKITIVSVSLKLLADAAVGKFPGWSESSVTLGIDVSELLGRLAAPGLIQ